MPTNDWWITETFDMSRWCGQNDVQIRFWLDADGSIERFGWLIDNIKIEDPNQPSVCGAGAICMNTPGSYRCKCAPTHWDDRGTCRLPTPCGVGQYFVAPHTATKDQDCAQRHRIPLVQMATTSISHRWFSKSGLAAPTCFVFSYSDIHSWERCFPQSQ